MELKKGISETEYGNFPIGWDFIKIQKLIDKKIIVDHLDGNHGSLYPRSNEFQDDGVPYISATDFLNGVVNFKNCKHLSLERAKIFQKGFAKNGDILFAHNATVGPVALLESNLDYIILSTTATYYRCDNKLLLNVYLKYALQAQYFVRQYQSVMAQSTRFQVPITAQRKFSIALPTKAEQTAIANALSDADALISSLEKLIEKKRTIKQGAMQQLLKPKKGWVEMTIDEICVQGGIVRGPFGGALKKESFVDKGFKVYEQKNAIYQSVLLGSYYVDYSKFNELKRFEIKEGDFIISCSGTIGKIFQIPNIYEKGIINQALLKLTIDCKKFSENYFYHYFGWENFQAIIIDSTQGGAMKNLIGMSEFRRTIIPAPQNLNEQIFIAGILSDMDNEITALEKKLSKSKMLKQGMMQELLTGKIRLV